MLKLNVLLGKVEHLGSSYKQSLKDYITFFTKAQGSFKGIRKTYLPRPDTIDLPSERESRVVVTTVQEKLDWLVETNTEYIDGLFEVEATNASGEVGVKLVVDGEDFGYLSSLELLRLISLLESEDLEGMYRSIPVRSDSENFSESDDEGFGYNKREGIYEGTKQVGTKKSITKEPYIMKDPNIDSSNAAILAKYTPIQAQRDTVMELGDWTLQHFTGEATHKERAEILRRRTRLLVAAKAALKTANEAPTVESSMTATKLFNFLHNGKL